MLSTLSRSWALQFSLDNQIQKNQKKCKERAGMLPDQISLLSKITNSNARTAGISRLCCSTTCSWPHVLHIQMRVENCQV